VNRTNCEKLSSIFHVLSGARHDGSSTNGVLLCIITKTVFDARGKIMADGYFISPDDAAQVEMLPGVHRRTLGVTDEVMLCEILLLRGSEVPAHQHLNDQVGYVIYGRIELTVGDETRIVGRGASYAIPGGLTHSARALVDTLIIDAFSPPREDYRTEAR
jgi:quercetin dioxygenase-like cupin family protein